MHRFLDVQKNLSREILYLELRRQFRFGSFNDGFGQIPNIKVSIFMGLSYEQWFKSSLTGKMVSEKEKEVGKREESLKTFTPPSSHHNHNGIEDFMDSQNCRTLEQQNHSGGRIPRGVSSPSSCSKWRQL